MNRKTLIASGILIAASLLLKLFSTLPTVAPFVMGAAAVVAGIPVALSAYRSAVNRHVSIEALVTVAAVGAMAIGEFWEAAAVTFLFNLGNYLEARTMARTRGVIGSLLELAPDTAVVLRGEEWVEIGAGEVQAGDTVVVRPGAQVPVDGLVQSGTSSVDESAITGEPYPRGVEAEDEVYAGTFNQAGMLTVEATAAGRDTTLARIIQRVEEAQEAKAPTQRFMERFSKWYTPGIIVGAAVMFAITRNIELALTILVIGCPGALVISTPVSVVAGIGGAAKRGILMKGGAHLEESGRITAVALDKTGTLTRGRPEVTETVVFPADGGEAPLRTAEPAGVGEGAAAGGAAGDAVAVSDTVSGGAAAGGAAAGSAPPRPAEVAAWDGTGGATSVAEAHTAVGSAGSAGSNGSGTQPAPAVSKQDLLYWAAIAEKGTEHPLSHAVLRAVSGADRVPNPERAEVLAGRGIEAGYDGHTILVGSPRLMEEQGFDLEPYNAFIGGGAGTSTGDTSGHGDSDTAVDGANPSARTDGATPVLVGLDGRLAGALFITDPIRSDAREAIAALYKNGVKKVVMLTGDNPLTAQHVADELGISDVYAGLLPDEKLTKVQELQSEGYVTAMVGDGVNDAPALAAANVGIAMGAAGNDVAIETADIALMRDDLMLLAQAVRRARLTLRNIRENVIVAMVTVAALLTGVLLGEVRMAGGMLIHEASVMVVVLNAMRLLRDRT